MIYVLDINGKPLMPTEKAGKVRHLLKDGKATVVKRTPFTIQLNYEVNGHTQPVAMGIKPGYERMYISCSTPDKELLSEEIVLRNNIQSLLDARRESRRMRRSRLRYRQARYSNRISSKKPGWIPPSLEVRIHSHISEIEEVSKILPVKDYYIELAKFDIKKLIDPDISGKDYQAPGFGSLGYNVRQYCLERDNHKCRCCKGKSNDKVIGVHHLKEYLKGIEKKEIQKRRELLTKHFSPDNTITICNTCHARYHGGNEVSPFSTIDTETGEIIEVTMPKVGDRFRERTYLNINRKRVTKALKEKYGADRVHIEYGFEGKARRIEAGLRPSREANTLCITPNANAKMLGTHYLKVRKRRHDRSIYKQNPSKGGVYKRCQSPKYIMGVKLWDKVMWDGNEGFIYSRNRNGYVGIKTLEGEIIKASAKVKDVKVLERQHNPIALVKNKEYDK